MFEFFQQEGALGANAPTVTLEGAQDSPAQFHNAAWDSYCTGVVFIQLAHLNVSDSYPPSKRFVSSELLAGLRPFENRINLIRASAPFLVSNSVSFNSPTHESLTRIGGKRELVVSNIFSELW